MIEIKENHNDINEVEKEVSVVVCVEGKKESYSSSNKGDEVVDSRMDVGWGRWYSLKELQMATNGFASGNVIGEGGYGVVYKGVLHDGSVVAVKNLLNNK